MQISLKRAIQSAIIIAFILITVMIWPGKLIYGWETEGNVCPESQNIVLNEGTLSQTFTAKSDSLSYIEFYIFNEEPLEGGTMIFRLFDEKAVKLQEKEFAVSELAIPGTCRIRVDHVAEAGKNYFFTIENRDSELLFSVSDGVNLDVAYMYKDFFPNIFVTAIWVASFIVGIILYIVTGRLLRENEVLVKYDLGVRLVLAAGVVLISLIGAFNVFPLKSFTSDWVNIIVLELGIILFCGYSLYGLLYHRKLDTERIDWYAKIPNILQTLAFTGIMLGGVRYLNALNIFEQNTSVRTVLCYFALMIICSYSKKELVNWYNIIYSILAVVWGYFHCKEVLDQEQAYTLAKGDALIVLFWGIVIANTISLLIKWKGKRISVIYLLAFACLVGEMIRSRHIKTWPIVIAVCWGLFAIRVVSKGKVHRYLNHFVNGVFIHFLGISIYAMLYRPFHFFTHVRYPGVFHTVTMAAVYDTFVLLLAITKFFMIYKDKKSLKDAWKELGMIGLSSSFLIFTVSRTGIFSAIIVFVLLFVFSAIFMFRDGFYGLIKRMGIIAVTIGAFFLITFAACRMIPAVVSKPFTYEIEWFQDSIRAGEEWDSFRFITIQKFLNVADAKMGYYVDPDKVVNPPKVENPENSVSSGDSIYITEDKKGLGANTDYTNGRLDIYKRYLEQLDWKGHEQVSIDYVEDGVKKATGHAHSVFIQMPHDFGIGAGIYFILFCIFAGIQSIRYYFCHKKEDTALFPVVVLATFGVCGLVEWVFIPYIPTGFAFLFILVLLIPAQRKGSNEKNI